MGFISNFYQQQYLYQQDNVSCFRGINPEDNSRYYVQSLSFLSEKQLLDLADYHKQISRNPSQGFPWLDFQQEKETGHVVFGDNNGQPLPEWIQITSATLADRLHIGIQIVDLCIDVYRSGFELHQLMLDRLLYDAKKDRLQLIDIEGLLPISSPKTCTKAYSHLYILGTTLFHLLTGYHYNNNRLDQELAYRVLPKALTDLLKQLLSQPSLYKTLWGIRNDLLIALSQLKSLGTIDNFALGHQDIPDKLQFSTTLYGREKEKKHLQKQLSRIAHSGKHFVFITGESGVGKTALVNSLVADITKEQGFFLRGKFDKMHRDTPYSGLVTALAGLTTELEQQGKTVTHSWRKRVIDSLGENVSIIVQLIPSLKSILDKQCTVPDLPPQENKYRFQQIIQQFLVACGNADQPMFLFLDDIQWIDKETLTLITLLQNNSALTNFLFIGAYRTKTLDADASVSLAPVVDHKQYTSTIKLAPFTLQTIKSMLAKLMHCSLETVQPLAKLLEQITRGNPFYLESLLQASLKKNHIFFNYQHIRWQWALNLIQHARANDTVTDFIHAKLYRLHPTTQHLLQQSACLGYEFSVDLLRQICQITTSLLQESLEQAVNSNLIIQRNKTEYQFYHDTIYHAIYESIPEATRYQMHYSAGKKLSQLNTDDQYLFNSVNQLNRAISIITDTTERKQLVQLNQRAATKARANASYGINQFYLHTALQLTPDSSWINDYSSTCQLFTAAAEAAYLDHRFSEMDRLKDILLVKAKNTADKIAIHEIKIQALIAQNKQLEAIQLSCSILHKLLGEKLSPNPKHAEIAIGLVKIQWHLFINKLKPQALLHLPEMTDPVKIASMRLYATLAVAAYRVKPTLFSVIAINMVMLSLKHGQRPESAYGYSVFGLILASLGFINHGYAFGELVIQSLEKPEAKPLIGKALSTTHFLIKHWKDHAKEANAPLLHAHKVALETGDVVFGAIASLEYCANLFFTQAPLNDLEAALAYHIDQVIISDDPTLFSLNLLRQCVHNLQTNVDTPHILIGQYYDEEQMVPQLRAAGDQNTLAVLYLYKLMLAYWFDHYDAAIDAANQVRRYIDGLKGMIHVPVFYFYDSLAHLAIYPKSAYPLQKIIRKRVKNNQKRLGDWAEHAPMNYQHKYLLVEAESYCILEHHESAAKYYEQASKQALSNDYRQEQALINERAALHCLSQDKEQYAKVHAIDAYHLYLRWGATTKADALLENHPQLLRNADDYLHPVNKHQSPARDISVLLQASQQLSSTLYLPELYDTFFTSIRRFLTLNHIVIVLRDNHQWKVVKTYPDSLPTVAIDDDTSHISHPIAETINTVIQSDKKVIINKSHSPSLSIVSKDEKTQSLACLPIKDDNNQTLGVIYLDNITEDGIFNKQSIDTLTTLCVQLAISITNAQKFDHVMASGELKPFISEIVHDVRNPLHSVIGLANRLLTKPDSAEDLQHFGENITTAAETALKIVNDLMDYSKIAAGHVTLENTCFNVEHVFKHLDILVGEQARQKQLPLTVNIDPDVPQALVGDSFRLGQVLTNLVSNAIKFTDSGSISIHTSVKNRDDNAITLLFSVEDTGIGIVPEKVDKLFDSYFQADVSTAKKYGGTGLGLSICKNLVELMGGTIGVESQLNEGSRFYFTLMAKVSETAIETTQKTTSIPASNIPLLPDVNILIIDDEHINLLIAEDILTPTQANITCVTSAAAALESIDKEDYHLILVDLKMPETDGYQFTQIVREGNAFKRFKAFKNIPIICLTANILDEDIEKCFAVGMNDYVKKPIKEAALFDSIIRWSSRYIKTANTTQK